MRLIDENAKANVLTCACIAVTLCSCTAIRPNSASHASTGRMEFSGFSFVAPDNGWHWAKNVEPYLAHGAKSGDGFDAQIQITKLKQSGERYTRTGEWPANRPNAANAEIRFEENHNATCKRYQVRWPQEMRFEQGSVIRVFKSIIDEQGLECINPSEPSDMVRFRYFIRTAKGEPNAAMAAEAEAFFESVMFSSAIAAAHSQEANPKTGIEEMSLAQSSEDAMTGFSTAPLGTLSDIKSCARGNQCKPGTKGCTAGPLEQVPGARTVPRFADNGYSLPGFPLDYICQRRLCGAYPDAAAVNDLTFSPSAGL